MALSETDRKRWDELHEHWNSKMKEQQEVAKKLSKCLDAEDGLVDNSKKVIKNLDAAIVASTQPGYFKYYQPTDNVQKIEERKEIDRLQKRIKSLQNEMDQGKGGFKTLLTLGSALFKLAMLIGVVPFVMFILAKIISFGGMTTVSSGIMKFATFMISRKKLDLEKLNRAQIQLMNQEIQQLKGSRCCSKT